MQTTEFIASKHYTPLATSRDLVFAGDALFWLRGKLVSWVDQARTNVLVLDPDTLEMRKTYDFPPGALELCVSEDARLMAMRFVSGTIHVADARTGSVLLNFKDERTNTRWLDLTFEP